MVDQLVAKSNAMRTSMGLPVKDIIEDSYLATDEGKPYQSEACSCGYYSTTVIC